MWPDELKNHWQHNCVNPVPFLPDLNEKYLLLELRWILKSTFGLF